MNIVELRLYDTWNSFLRTIYHSSNFPLGPQTRGKGVTEITRPTCYFARETEDQRPAETTQSMTGQKLEPGCPDSHLHMLGVTHKAKYYNNRWWNLLRSLKSVYFFFLILGFLFYM